VAQLTIADLIDPRGRVNRTGLILTAAVLIGAQCGIAFASHLLNFELTGVAGVVIELVMLWLGLVAVAKRLHDLDYGFVCVAWVLVAVLLAAIATAVGVMMVLGEDALLPGHVGYTAVAAVVFLPIIAAAFWLHAAPGVDGANRFGAQPGSNGFSGPMMKAEQPLGWIEVN
jgi:uncharacterized membrane protein YhaH (DUF805 family)